MIALILFFFSVLFHRSEVNRFRVGIVVVFGDGNIAPAIWGMGHCQRLRYASWHADC